MKKERLTKLKQIVFALAGLVWMARIILDFVKKDHDFDVTLMVMRIISVIVWIAALVISLIKHKQTHGNIDE